MNINYEQRSGFNTGAEHSRLQHQRDRRRQLHHARALVFVKLRQIPHACVGSSLCTVHVLRRSTMTTRMTPCIHLTASCSPSPPCNIASLTRLNAATTMISPYLICLRPTSGIRMTSPELLVSIAYRVAMIAA